MMKLSYLGLHNPILSHFSRFSSQNDDHGHGRHRPSSSPSVTSTRFQFNNSTPHHLKSSQWQLQPLQTANAALAYEAYLSNPNALVTHRRSSHLVKSYTWQDHIERIDRFELEHQIHARFSFIVLDNTAAKCLGCVHIRPLRPFLYYSSAPAHLIVRAQDNTALITYWLHSCLEPSFQTQFLATLHQWLTRKWEFPDHFFRVNLGTDDTTAVMENAGLQSQFSLKFPTYHYEFYGA
jgi:hypothetical protein